MHLTHAVTYMLPWLMLLPWTQQKQWASPNKRTFDCPTSEELDAFARSIQGSVVLPGNAAYTNATIWKNLVYNSQFAAIVYPETTQDVQKAILFARKYGLRPTVSSTGHDYIGRSAGDDTFHINLARMKELRVDMSDTSSPTGKSVTFGTGNVWAEVYLEVHNNGGVVVGGSAHTVSPGGYILGGGHSPLTRMLGLGVDSVLEFTLVTADGSIVTVNENGGTATKSKGVTEQLNDNGDLWWATLGGGGGVFGIVTQFKYKVNTPPSDGFVIYSAAYPIVNSGLCSGVAEAALENFLLFLRNGLSNSWGGYFLIASVAPDDAAAGSYDGTLTFFMNHWGGNEAQARASIQTVSSYRTDCHLWEQFTYQPSFWDYEKSVTDDSIYLRAYTVNTLLQPGDMVRGNGLAGLLTSVEQIPDVDVVGCTGTLLGGAGNDFPYEAKSASPDLRSALVSFTCGGVWLDKNKDAKVAEAMNNFASSLYNYGTGVYYNEPELNLDNWKVEYYTGKR